MSTIDGTAALPTAGVQGRGHVAPTLGAALAREVVSHVRLTVRLAVVWAALPLLGALMGPASPAVVRVVTLDPEATAVSAGSLAGLYELLFAGIVWLVGSSFVARAVLVPGRASGDVQRDIVGRRSVRVGAAVAAVNFVGLVFGTAATVEAWILPIFTVGVCHLAGVLAERLRADHLWW